VRRLLHSMPSLMVLSIVSTAQAQDSARASIGGSPGWLAWVLLGGLLVGYFQARAVYNRDFNRVDPKIVLTTLTFLAYLAVLLLSGRPAFKGRRTALASVAVFFLLMANFWASVFWSDMHRFR